MDTYEKKYKEALERARDVYTYYCDDREQLRKIESIFPELKESEDERIRKELCEIVNDWCNERHSFIIDKEYAQKILTWLEKQGEKEYALKSSKDVDVHKFVQYIERQAKAYELNLPNRSYDIYGFAKDILSWLEKESSQNLANSAKTCKVEQNPAWSEADENRLKVVISFVNSNPAEDPFYDKGCLKDWLKSLKDRYTWKPSDEQIGALDDVISSRDVKYNILSELWKELKKLKG